MRAASFVLFLPLFLLLLCMAPYATAQEVDWQRLYPLDIGDTWTYEVAYGQGQYEYEPIELVGYQRRTVVGDTVVAGEAYRLVRVDSLSSAPDYLVLGEALCAVRVLEATGRVEWVAVDVSGGGACWVPEVAYDLDFRAGSPGGDSLYINARLHDMEDVEAWGGAPEPQETPLFQAAADLGLTEWRSAWAWNNGLIDRSLMRLIHATVGGEEYGRPIDSDAWRAFYPLNEGDVYEYSRSYGCYPHPNCSGYIRLDVGADTTIDGEAYQIVRQRRFDEEFELLSNWQCFTRVRENGRVARLGSDGSLEAIAEVG